MNRPTQLALDLAIDVPQTLGNFVPGPNTQALAALRETCAGRGERSLLLWGPTGSGKSHLLRAASQFFAGQGSHYLSVTPDAELPEWLAAKACVAIDNVEQLNPGAQEGLFHLFNKLREGGGILLVSADQPPSALPIRADLATRLAWGLVYALHPLTDDDKHAALQRLADSRGMPWSEELSRYLLNHTPRDLPSLLNWVEQLDKQAIALRRPVSLTLARELLQASQS